MRHVAPLLLALSLTACATGGGQQQHISKDAEDFPTLINQAQQAIDNAAAIGSEWRDSRKYLTMAQELEKAGKHDKAMEMARRAKHQGELSYQQGMAQRDAGPWLF